MGTRTYTVFFMRDKVKPLQEAIANLWADYEWRQNNIPPMVREAYEQRLKVLDNAAKLLLEPVSEAMY